MHRYTLFEVFEPYKYSYVIVEAVHLHFYTKVFSPQPVFQEYLPRAFFTYYISLDSLNL